MTRLAVDLGTSHTVAVVERPGQQPRPLLFDGSPVLPSGVFAAAGGIHVGRDAERLSQLEPHRYEPHPKRRVDEGTVLLGDTGYPVATLLGALLHRVVQEAGHVSSAVITCPAGWGRLRRQVLIDAAHQAGLHDPVLVDEPVAAAAYCTRVLGGHVSAGHSLLVFDFGGGTLDLALVRRDQVVGVSGLENLGGLDIDEALVGHLGRLIAARDPGTWQRLSRPSNPVEQRDRRAFRAEVRIAKEMLSRTTAAPVGVPGWADTLHLTREELDGLAGPLIDRAVDETRRLLDGAGIAPDGILLVGGSSRIPLVATRLHSRFGVAPIVPEQPELPVALGALASVENAAPVSGAAAPTSGAAAPVSGPRGYGAVIPTPAVPGSPVSGAAAPVSGMPGTPVSGGYLSGDDTNTGLPTSGDGGAWTGRPPAAPGQPPATPWDAPPPRRSRSSRRSGPRGATIVAIAASLTLVVLAGATIWFVRDALRDGGNPGGSRPHAAGTAGPSAPASSAPADRGPAPTGFAWCEAPEKALLCPTTPICETADNDEVDCAQPHATELFAAGILPGEGFAGADKIGESPEVKAGCSAATLTLRTSDRNRTEGWSRYAQWQWRNGVNMFLCFTGPETGTTTGSVIKQAPPR